MHLWSTQLAFIADAIAQVTGVLGMLVISFGVTMAIVRFILGLLFERHTVGENITKHHVDPIRVGLGRFINLGLEFLIAKDAIETIFAHTWDDLTQLFLLVIIRTIVSFFLMYEIEKIEHRRYEPTQQPKRKRRKRTVNASS